MDPSSADGSVFHMDALEKELQDDREREALLIKTRAKIGSLGPPPPDPRDSVGRS